MLLAVAIVALVPQSLANDNVLAGKGKEMADAWLKAQVVNAAKREGPNAQDFFEEERQRRKKILMQSLGLDPMPERTPLKARTTGTLLRRGYRIEKIVFESRPDFFVTAHVYSPYPPVTKKVPVIVNLNGHWQHKKNEDRVQLRCAFQAIRGFIAIAIDSPGHSFEGDSLIERREQGDHNDAWLVQGGSNATGYYVWDAMRALDYVATRSDTDMTKIGITGASGGGLATLYAFAADDRYKVAVPVVYMSSLELAPDNGCLCNHVPGTMQIGDRSDVLAIQAPKPVYIIGADSDPEFPPSAMRLTVEKCKKEWGLFGKQAEVNGQIFPGPHDYNQAMRESAMGFFDKHLRGIGEGKPIGQPPIQLVSPTDRTLLVLDPPPTRERTMRDLTLEYLKYAKESKEKVPIERVFEINGGQPSMGDINWSERGDGNIKTVTFHGEPGLTTPGVLVMPKRAARATVIYVSDEGKAARIAKTSVPDDAYAFFLDLLGTGELSGINLRYPIYLGRSVPYIGGAQIARAAAALRPRSNRIEVVAHGPLATLAATYAALLDPSLKVTATDCLKEWSDYLTEGVPQVAVQPRAHLLPPLSELRKRTVGTWQYRTISPKPDPKTREGNPKRP